MRYCIIFITYCAGILAAGCSIADTVTSAEKTVHAFVDAYNDRDLETLLGLCTEDVRWMSIDGKSIRIETDGTAALRRSLAGDFSTARIVSSAILNAHASGPQVSVIEKATWQTEKGERSQCSIAVYYLEDNKIRDIWYFPAHTCKDSAVRTAENASNY